MCKVIIGTYHMEFGQDLLSDKNIIAHNFELGVESRWSINSSS